MNKEHKILQKSENNTSQEKKQDKTISTTNSTFPENMVQYTRLSLNICFTANSQQSHTPTRKHTHYKSYINSKMCLEKAITLFIISLFYKIKKNTYCSKTYGTIFFLSEIARNDKSNVNNVVLRHL